MDPRRFNRSCAGVVALALATLLVTGLGAMDQRGRRPAVYVVAAKDSAVLTMCPELREATMAGGQRWKSDGRATVMPFTDDLQRLRFPPRESTVGIQADLRLRTEVSATQAILPIPRTDGASPSTMPVGTELGTDVMVMDPALRRTVERELTRLGRHEIAESVELANLVLVIDGSYTAFATSGSSTEMPRDKWTGGQAPPALNFFAQPGDWQRNVLQAVLGIAVPAEIYRANPGDVPAWMSARIWEGSEVYQPPHSITEESRRMGGTPTAGEPPPPVERRRVTHWRLESASAEALVWQFAGRKRRPASHPPLCAVSSQIFQVPSGPASTTATAAVAASGAKPAGVKATGAARSATAFKSDVTYVSVPVSVTDGEGRAVVDLDPSRFRIYENDTPQVIDRVDRAGEPLNVTLLIDASSSMRVKGDETHAAILAAVKALSRIGTPTMVSFDRRVMVHSTLPDERDRYRPVFTDAFGRTATRLYDALDLLLTGPLKSSSARTALVILTDGVDTASRMADAETALRRLGESSTPAHVVQYDTSQDNAAASMGRGFDITIQGVGRPDMKPQLVPEGAGDPVPIYARATRFLREMTDISGGRLHAVSTLADLEKTFTDIATELSQQYTIAYYPTNQARDGTYRRLRVEIERSGVNVRTRAGYFQSLPGDRARPR